MGMDVIGREPSQKEGKYFRATIWEWGSIHDLMGRLCRDLLVGNDFGKMALNMGKGPMGQSICTEMACRFEEWLLRFPGKTYYRESTLRVDEHGRVLTDEEVADNSEMKHRSAYSVDREHLRTWVGFLRYCGGFEVW